MSDPCTHTSCPKFSTCQPSFDGASASCLCPQHCPEPADPDANVVCGELRRIGYLTWYYYIVVTLCGWAGSDGRDYPTECHLEKAACDRRQVDLVVRYLGRCNPCSALRCDASKECHLAADEEDSRTPACECDLDCPDDFAPVCASNGKTVSYTTVLVVPTRTVYQSTLKGFFFLVLDLQYRHECFMRLESCRLREPLHAVYSGNCSSGREKGGNSEKRAQSTLKCW